MVKINVKIVLLEDGLYLFYPKTNTIFEYKYPHKIVGYIDNESNLTKK